MRLDVEAVRSAICTPYEAEHESLTNELLAETDISGRRLQAARRGLLAEMLVGQQIDCGWLIRCSPTASLMHQAA